MMAGHVLKHQDFAGFCKAPLIKMGSRKKLHHADPFNKFDWLMDISESLNLKSSFYFLCGRSSEMDADYEPEHPAIRELMRRMHTRGHEIGLHPSYGSYRTPSIIKKEAERLRRIAADEGIEQSEWGGRMHYLRWDQSITLRAWADAGMSYDSTLGYADRPGFRCGTCFEYPAFDPVGQQQLTLRLRPLIVMEGTVISDIYMGLDNSVEALNLINKYKNICRTLNGNFTMLWHNSSFPSVQQEDVYKRILAQ